MDEVGTMSRITHAFNEQELLIDTLIKSILKNLQTAIDKNGKASLIVSGGSTPKPLFKKLSKEVFTWEKVTVGLCDERWVNTSDTDSNEHFVKEYLLKYEAKKAKFIGMYKDEMSIFNAQSVCSQKMEEGLYPFDIILLGMGSDGHTASLFPKNIKLKEAYDLDNISLCIAIEPSTAPHMRMSLTLSAILSASHVYLHFEGEEKRSVYDKAIKGTDNYEMPIRSVLNQEQKEIEVFYR